jgi:hypothetical protein
MCKPHLPVMMLLVNNIIKWLNDMSKEQKVPISDIHFDFDDIISGTGPPAFTVAVLQEMSRKVGHTVTWDTFHNMAESKLIGGVLVLTVEAFAERQGHSDSGNHNARTALVKHHYHASQWPIRHPRYNHPVYGEVERCSWEPECVKNWDFNRATFDALPKEEQERQIVEKRGRRRLRRSSLLCRVFSSQFFRFRRLEKRVIGWKQEAEQWVKSGCLAMWKEGRRGLQKENLERSCDTATLRMRDRPYEIMQLWAGAIVGCASCILEEGTDSILHTTRDVRKQ